MVSINESVCESGISDTPVKAFVNWDPPRAVFSPIKAYVIHFITAQGVDIQIRVPPNETQHFVDSVECWTAYILRVEAVFESGVSAFSRALFYATGNQGHDFMPRDVIAIEDRTSCEEGGKYAFVNLRWRPARLGNFNVSGYTVTVYADNGTTNSMRFGNDTRVLKYVPIYCDGTTVIGVSARTRVNLGLFDYEMGEIIFPAAYVAISIDTEPYIVPSKETTTTAPCVTKGKSTVTERPSSTTTERSTTKVTATTKPSSATTVASTEHIATTTEPHHSSTISNNVEPVSSGVSTSTILCAVLIPLAVIVFAGLLFFGYKKFKQSGGEGLLSASDSP
ncbi:uncharacterized protein LOC119402630 [Rhipicephalus sanguineus]|uniref:uncharacterized protein LOC119402630 n=1 Tax=Rhipicephalus sanguineus TaxID=34632 RepID=UPI0020C24C26|nr:uncharacterized protein LOC119402630 [Rhipicephalus sanguineus]